MSLNEISDEAKSIQKTSSAIEISKRFSSIINSLDERNSSLSHSVKSLISSIWDELTIICFKELNFAHYDSESILCQLSCVKKKILSFFTLVIAETALGEAAPSLDELYFKSFDFTNGKKSQNMPSKRAIRRNPFNAKTDFDLKRTSSSPNFTSFPVIHIDSADTEDFKIHEFRAELKYALELPVISRMAISPKRMIKSDANRILHEKTTFEGEEHAAIAIQKIYRGFAARKECIMLNGKLRIFEELHDSEKSYLNSLRQIIEVLEYSYFSFIMFLLVQLTKKLSRKIWNFCSQTSLK